MNPYLIPHLPTDRAFTWIFTADPNKRHGALLTAIDHQENRFYAGEHYAEGLPDSKHAEAYRKLFKAFGLRPNRDVTLFADPGGAGAQAIVNMAEVGIYMQPVPKDAGSVKASIERIRRAAWIDPGHRHPLADDKSIKDSAQWRHLWGLVGAPHCYFLTSLRSEWTLDGVEYRESRLMWELRQYRQKEKGKPDEPIKEKDDVVDPMRYVELVRPFAPVEEDKTAQRERAELAKRDRLSRKANDEFDELVERMNNPQPQATEEW